MEKLTGLGLSQQRPEIKNTQCKNKRRMPLSQVMEEKSILSDKEHEPVQTYKKTKPQGFLFEQLYFVKLVS